MAVERENCDSGERKGTRKKKIGRYTHVMHQITPGLAGFFGRAHLLLLQEILHCLLVAVLHLIKCLVGLQRVPDAPRGRPHPTSTASSPGRVRTRRPHQTPHHLTSMGRGLWHASGNGMQHLSHRREGKPPPAHGSRSRQSAPGRGRSRRCGGSRRMWCSRRRSGT